MRQRTKKQYTVLVTRLLLTLILPGEVKVDLANFDAKFRTKFLNIRFLKIDLFLQKRLPNLLELLT
jgi:hypothetical protein